MDSLANSPQGPQPETSPKVIGIHQPNFFPWLGFFQKIACSDVFVCLDSVQFPRSAGTWTNRVKLLIAGDAKWATASIARSGAGLPMIQDTTYDGKSPWRQKLIRTIETSYKRTPHFTETMNVIEPLINNSNNSVVQYNMLAIRAICDKLGIDTVKMCMSSQIPNQDSSNERLISIVEALEGNVYLCGSGAMAYHDQTLFEEANLEVEHLNFKHPEYPQHNRVGEFVAGLSVIDALMNVGFKGTRALIAPCRSRPLAESAQFTSTARD